MILNPLVSHFLRLLNSQNLRCCVKSSFFFLLFLESWTRIWKGSFLPTVAIWFKSQRNFENEWATSFLPEQQVQPAPEEPANVGSSLGWAAASCLHVSLKKIKTKRGKKNNTGQYFAENSLASQLLGEENDEGNIHMVARTSIKWLVSALESIKSHWKCSPVTSRGVHPPPLLGWHPSSSLAPFAVIWPFKLARGSATNTDTGKTIPHGLLVHFDHRLFSFFPPHLISSAHAQASAL